MIDFFHWHDLSDPHCKSLVFSLAHLLTRSLAHSLAGSFAPLADVRSLICSIACSLTCSFTHSLNGSLAHLLVEKREPTDVSPCGHRPGVGKKLTLLPVHLFARISKERAAVESIDQLEKCIERTFKRKSDQLIFC